jgi:hypothetical protein
MNWFGLNWLDIFLNVVALAAVPGFLAAYGGHLAAEAIVDKKRSRKVKAYFWLLFSFGVIVTFWQQFRIAESDFARETREQWGQAVITRLLFSPPLPPSEPTHSPSSATQIPAKPDLAIRIVNPATPGIILLAANSVAHNVKADPVLWDIDRDDNSADSLFVNEAKYDWIRSDQHGGPTALIHPDQNNLVKPGHRVLGYITVACPDCKNAQVYWVYFVYGQGGWYSRMKEGPDPIKIAKAIPALREGDPEKYFAAFPQSSRVPIRELQ